MDKLVEELRYRIIDCKGTKEIRKLSSEYYKKIKGYTKEEVFSVSEKLLSI